jgi:hypothetical protein
MALSFAVAVTLAGVVNTPVVPLLSVAVTGVANDVPGSTPSSSTPTVCYRSRDGS